MVEQPSKEAKSVREILPRLNDSLFIPCLQRDYCWDQSQVEMLWDSLLRGLPLGSLLIWDDEKNGPRKEPAYSFIQHYVNSRSFSFEDHIRRYSQRFSFDELPASYSLVLDGQQRLTSFYIGLHGSYTTRSYRGWVSNRGAWNQRELYLDVLSGTSASDDDRALVYEFDFRKSGGLSSSEDSYWYPVSGLIEDSGSVSRDSFLNKRPFLNKAGSEVQEAVPNGEYNRAKSNLERLWWAVNEQEAILYERTLTNEKSARELFIRRNKGGKVLSKVDILLALLTGYWEKVDDEGSPTDAKNQIEKFTKRLSEDEQLSEFGFTFGKNFTLRTLLMLSGERPAFRKNGRYDGDHLRKAESIFNSDQFEQAVRESFLLSAEFGFHNAGLSSKNVVTPVILYLLDTDDSPDQTDRRAIKYWLATTVLNGVFGDIGSERVLRTARSRIKSSDTDHYPATAILDDLDGTVATVHLDQARLEELLNQIDYQYGASLNVLLTHLYADRRAGSETYEVDHIFPKGKLTDGEFLRDNGVDPDRVEFIKENPDHIANLQLLTPHENKSKSDRNLVDWLETIEAGNVDSLDDQEDYFIQHHVPKESHLHEYQNYPEFISRRLEKITDRLNSEFPFERTV